MNYDFGTGGWDVEFTVSLGDGDDIIVVGGMVVDNVPVDDVTLSTAKTQVTITQGAAGSGCTITVASNSRTQRSFEYHKDADGKVRVIAHSRFITVYINDAWAKTFHFAHVRYRETRYVALNSSTSSVVTSVRLKELADWREAIWIDMESSSMNAISSVILQRPVEIFPKYDGSLSFSFDPDRSEVTLSHPKMHREQQALDQQAASDAIAYFTDVAVVPNLYVAEHYGFVTRLYRLPDLDQDAVQSTKIMLEDAIRRSKQRSFSGRFHPNMELGDIIKMQFNYVDTQTSYTRRVIVESMNINIGDGLFQFEGNGRHGEAIT